MMRNVYFEGELGDKFIPHMHMKAENVAEVFQCLNGNFPNFKQYILEKQEEGIGFHIDVAGNELEDPRELLLELKEGDIIVTPIPAGAKSGPAKILAAIALVVVAIYVPGMLTYTGQAVGGYAPTVSHTLGTVLAGQAGTLAQVAATAALGMATNLALTGITQMMAPDPSTDGDQEQSYLFNGSRAKYY
jgi:predicted phage tail protein